MFNLYPFNSTLVSALCETFWHEKIDDDCRSPYSYPSHDKTITRYAAYRRQTYVGRGILKWTEIVKVRQRKYYLCCYRENRVRSIQFLYETPHTAMTALNLFKLQW